jgi:hypothetical protein
MCHHVYGLNLCYDDDPLVITGPFNPFSRPLMCQMQLLFSVTAFLVAVLVGGLRSHLQKSSRTGRHRLPFEDSCVSFVPSHTSLNDSKLQ